MFGPDLWRCQIKTEYGPLKSPTNQPSNMKTKVEFLFLFFSGCKSIQHSYMSDPYVSLSLYSCSDASSDDPRVWRGRRSLDPEPGRFESFSTRLRLWPAGLRSQLSPLVPVWRLVGWGAVCYFYRAVETVTGAGAHDPIGPQSGWLPGDILHHPISRKVHKT